RTQDAGHALLRQGRNPKVRKNSGVIDIHRFGNVHTIRFLNAFLYLKGVRILTYIVVWVSGRERSYFSRNDFHLLRQKSDWKLEDAA
ncbi:hypothetical protein PL925_07805, partial [Bifidobacterium adolescentis]|nr:hypothetical protein [Bifidobacterium adolescentis]